ncbi:helix-turn-helix transcriptional regulator [Pseudomonadota bacterium]|nr:helix-turn-helix transcriptional regulator [Pseudomonadota bacterium]
MEIKLGFSWQIAQQDIDPILFHLLVLIQREGSLQQATKKAHVSYRFAWGLLNKWQGLLEHPLVILERGRGATLSPAGEALVKANQRLIARFSPELDNISTQFKREFELVLSSQVLPRTTIFASHGLAISALRDIMHQQSDMKLDLHFYGSLESIRSLGLQKCDIAGFHIPEGSIARELSPQYLSILNANSHQLIYVVKRNQGLMTQQGNPKNINNIKSLTKENVEFINRQSDSGTRLLFDQLLKTSAVTPNQIQGYQNEEFTHIAIAAMIASGAADVGFGIAPVAEKFNLAFTPLLWEHYCLAVPISLSNDPHVKQIIAILQSDEFKQKLAGLTGYDTQRSGQLVGFSDVFD